MLGKELLVLAAGGDREAFGEIVRLHMKRAYRSALTLSKRHHEAMDLSQEAFARAFRAIKSFDPERPFFPWYYRILKNLWINQLRRAKSARFVSISPDPERDGPQYDFPSDEEGPFVAVEKREEAETLAREMAALSPEKREILNLRHFEHLSYREIAETLDIPEGTVMSRLHSARASLAGRMEKYYEHE